MSAQINDLFSSVCSEFIQSLKDAKRASATILAYSKDVEQLFEFTQGKKGRNTPGEIQKEDIEDFLRSLSEEGYTAKSLSRKINSIKTLYRYLKGKNMIQANPAAEITHPKFDIKPPRILTKLEYRALRDACRTDARTYAIVELFLQTGLRIGELAKLEIDDVKDSEVFIRQYEGHKERFVPLNRAAKQAVDSWMSVRPQTEDKTLFVTKTGRPLLVRNVRTTIDRYFKIAGIESAKVNDLRHTFIAHHLASGTPLTVISKLVGHKRLSTTEKYLDLVKETPKEKVKLEEL